MIRALALMLAVAVTQTPATVAVEKVAAPEKALRFEVIVPAPLDDVWTAFTTKAGLETWLWKETRVDFRPGGEWTVLYTPTATGGGAIVSIEPKTQVVMRALAPEQFPTVRAERTTAVFSFAAVTPQSTRVTLVQTGWKAGAEWDAAYDYLAQGNAQLLTQLHRRFATGPIVWPGQ